MESTDGNTHTHTQLSLHGKLWRTLSNALSLLIALALTVSLISLTSCSSSDNPAATQTLAPPTGDESGASGKTNHQINAWYDGGLLHNQILRACDDSAAVGFPNRFTTYGAYLTWMFDDALSDYIVQNTNISSTTEAAARAAFWANDSSEIHYSDSELALSLADMVSDGDISSRESSFIQRQRNINNLCYGSTAMSVIADSMADWKSDILAVSWLSTEKTIVPFMSIAYYSFDFWLNEGMDQTVPDYDGPTVLRDGPNAVQADIDAWHYAVDVLHYDPIADADFVNNFAADASARWAMWFAFRPVFN